MSESLLIETVGSLQERWLKEENEELRLIIASLTEKSKLFKETIDLLEKKLAQLEKKINDLTLDEIGNMEVLYSKDLLL